MLHRKTYLLPCQRDLITKNIPNFVTLSGMFLNLFCFFRFYQTREDVYVYLSVSAFWLDFVDGKLARWLDAQSRLGNTLDKVSDKICQLGLLILTNLCFGVSYVFVVHFLVREICMFILRLCRVKKSHSSSLSKLKTFIFPYYFLLYWWNYTLVGYCYLSCVTCLNYLTLFVQ